MVLITYSLGGAGLHTISAFYLFVHFSNDGVFSVCRWLLLWLDLLKCFCRVECQEMLFWYRLAVEASITTQRSDSDVDVTTSTRYMTSVVTITSQAVDSKVLASW